MKIVVCDDEKFHQDEVANALRVWIKDKDEVLELLTYSSAEAMLFDRDLWVDADGLILDIEMRTMNGMQLAREVRSVDSQVPLAFLTGYEAYVFEGYEVGALAYLLKPIQRPKFEQVLDQMLDLKTKLRNRQFLFVETKEGTEKLFLDEILYIESQLHKCLIRYERNQVNGELMATQGLGTFTKHLEGQGFCMPHRSYLVNIAKARRISRQDMSVDGGFEIPIARGKWESIHQSYLDFHRKHH